MIAYDHAGLVMSDTYLRCRHCRGFYESDRSQCKWCSYETPFTNAAGAPVVYPDRATCRAIQVSEYDQLPREAKDDPMGPPIDEPDLQCACLHCGPEGERFEVIEMRWMAGERLWACPCTTCGGRGFQIDIHPAELGWQCSQCRHRFAPADGRYVASNARCPKCGSTHIDGWFEDEYDEEEFDFDEDDEASDEPDPADSDLEEPLPWEEDDERTFDTGVNYPDGDNDLRERMPDDIDFPRYRPPADETESGPDDIPF